MNVYKTLPEFAGKKFCLRKVATADAEALLKVYSDKEAAKCFNGDNCHGDDFYYDTLEKMRKAIDFWLFSYERGYFVRWAVVENASGNAVGTVELFHRDGEQQEYSDCGLLRLDLASRFERAEDIADILKQVIPPAYDLFYCDKIVTKVKPFAEERLKAVKNLGFTPAKEPLKAEDGESYTDYYKLCK